MIWSSREIFLEQKRALARFHFRKALAGASRGGAGYRDFLNYSQIVDLNPSLDYELLQRAQALERFLDRRSCTNSGLAVARATISCCNHFLRPVD